MADTSLERTVALVPRVSASERVDRIETPFGLLTTLLIASYSK